VCFSALLRDWESRITKKPNNNTNDTRIFLQPYHFLYAISLTSSCKRRPVNHCGWSVSEFVECRYKIQSKLMRTADEANKSNAGNVSPLSSPSLKFELKFGLFLKILLAYGLCVGFGYALLHQTLHFEVLQQRLSTRHFFGNVF